MFTKILVSLEKVFGASPFLGLLISFVAGFLASFSPCIYPLIPVTVSIVGAASTTNKKKGFILSLVFVSGICVTYTTIGVAAAFFGKLMGSFFAAPAAYFILSAVFLFLGLCFIGVFELNIFSFSFGNKNKQEKGLLPLFFLGVVSGLALIPCNYPVLGAILAMIALKKSVVYGACSLFLFSLGYGTILIILGTFTSLVGRLPKQGPWLLAIKRIMGAVMLIIAVYFFLKFKDVTS